MSELKNINPVITAVQETETGVILSLKIPEDLDYFKGHFPGAPILAGVVQLHWAVEFANKYLSLETKQVENVEVLKFKVVIIPGQELNLILSQKSPFKFIFSYESGKGLHASGRVVLLDDNIDIIEGE